ncbi:MAG: hypothetical protein ACRCYU_08195, partial [Nocardioides sp.]
WDTERAAGRTPTGTELAAVAGVDPTMGRRWRRAWLGDPTPTRDGATAPIQGQTFEVDLPVDAASSAAGRGRVA